MFPDSLLHQPVFFPYLFPKNKQTSYCGDWNSLPPVCSASKRVHNMSPAFWSGKMQRHEKIDALKPVASRPFSSFRSFPKPLQDFTSTGSPPITVLEETVLVKPKATRFPSLQSELPTKMTATIVSLALEFSSYFFCLFLERHVFWQHQNFACWYFKFKDLCHPLD